MNARWLMMVLCCSPLAGASSQDAGTSCHVSIAQAPRRLQLPDGRTVSTDVKSVATSHGTVMAVGDLAYVFPAGATPRADAVMRDSIIGFIINANGVSMVPKPPGVVRVSYPRVVAAPGGSFHMLFATTADNQNGLTRSDTATIWYARYVDNRWTTPERVQETRGAQLLTETASQLLERDNELAFLFPHNTSGSRGLVLLRRRENRWIADTLRTTAEPRSVAAVHASDGSLVAAFTMSGRAVNPAYTDVLFTARFRSSWSIPQYAGGTTRPVGMAKLLPVGDTIVATWIEWMWGDANTSQLQWRRLGIDSSAMPVASGRTTYPFEALALNDRHPIWLLRGVQYGASLAPLIGTESTVESLATLEVPFENPKANAVVVSDGRVLVLTMKQGKLPDEPMVASYATVLQFRCPQPARRE